MPTPFLNQTGTGRKSPNVPHCGNDFSGLVKQVRGMATRIGPRRPLRLYLVEWREQKGVTQEQLATRLGTTHVTISRWETQKRQPDLNAQAAIAEALGIELVDLFRHPDRPSADALLRGQPPEVVENALKMILAIRR